MDRINAYLASGQLAHQPNDRAVPTASAAGARQSPTLSGYCKLDKGRSMTLQAREASVLRITRGRVWLTFNPALKEPSARVGDHFLSRGESVSLAAEEAVVMESYGPGDAPSAYYSWEPVAASNPVTALTPAAWRAGVLQPLRDLRLALGLTAGALGRLARGLAGGVVAAGTGILASLATIFVAARARGDWAERTFKSQSGDTCVHCSSR
jgi:hypothetical protein